MRDAKAQNYTSFSDNIDSKTGGLRFDRNLGNSESVITMLYNCGLLARFPAEYNAWSQQKEDTRRALKREKNIIKENLAHSEELKSILLEAIFDVTSEIFPYVSLEASHVGKISNMII